MFHQSITASLFLYVLISVACLTCDGSVIGGEYRSIQGPSSSQLDEFPFNGMSPEAIQYTLNEKKKQDNLARRLRNQINIVHMALDDLSSSARLGQLSVNPNEPIIPTIIYAQPTAPPVAVKRETARWNQLRGMWG